MKGMPECRNAGMAGKYSALVIEPQIYEKSPI
jgi:hypothetical protein